MGPTKTAAQHGFQPASSRIALVVPVTITSIVVLVFDWVVRLGDSASVPTLPAILQSVGFFRRATCIAATQYLVLAVVGWHLPPDGGNAQRVFSNRLLALLTTWRVTLICWRSKFRGCACASQISTLDKSRMRIEFDLDGTTIAANQSILATTGYSLQDIRGKYHRIFVGPSLVESEAHRDSWAQRIRGDKLPAKLKQHREDGRRLLAKDDPDNQRLIGFILCKDGKEVTLADNGQIALELALAAQDDDVLPNDSNNLAAIEKSQNGVAHFPPPRWHHAIFAITLTLSQSLLLASFQNSCMQSNSCCRTKSEHSCDSLSDACPSSPSQEQYECIRDLYRDAGDDFLRWSPEGNFHFGYWRFGINPFSRQQMLREMNLQIFAGLELPRVDSGLIGDLGCGIGAACRQGQALYSHLNWCGVSLSEEQVGMADRRSHSPAINYIVGDYHQLPWPDACLDGAYFIESLCYSPRPSDALAEAARALKPGRRLVVADAMFKRPVAKSNRFFQRMASLTAKNWAVPQFHLIADIKSAANQVGLDIVETREVSWRVIPSALHSIPLSSYLLLRHLLTREPSVWRWNQLKASAASLSVGLHRRNFGYYLLVLEKARTSRKP